MNRLIGINGIKGSGKDFLGKLVADRLIAAGFTVQFRKFADPIKFAVEEIFGDMTEDQYDDFKRTQHPMIIGGDPRLVFGRDIVRGVGMKMRSYDGGQQFLDYVVDKNEMDKPTDFVIVTDLRFGNEFELDWFWKQKVVAKGVESDGHESEANWPPSLFSDVYTHNFDGEADASDRAGMIVVALTNKLAMEQINAKRT